MDAFEQSLKIQPEGIRALNSLARLLAAPGAGQRRDPGRAVALASRAVALSPQPDPGLLETLMIAHAEAGNMDAARKVGQNAIDLAERAGASEFARRVEELLEAYRMRARNAEW
jgi:hypothetical protein